MIEGLLTGFWLALGLASIELVGYGLLLVWLPRASNFTALERFALGFGLGALVLTLWMLGLTFLNIDFSLPWVLGPWLIILNPGWALGSRRRLWYNDLRQLWSTGRKIVTLGYGCGWTWRERAWLILLVLAFAFALLRATLYPLWSWDAVTTWGLKAKAFYLSRAIDLSRFEAHNYYPNLVPLLMTYIYLWLGGVIDHLVKAIFPLWGGCLVLMFYSFLRRLQVKRPEALLGTAFLVLNGPTLITHFFIAYADLALTYYTLVSAGLLFLWLRGQAPAGSLILVAIFGGGMLWSKYEGWPLVMINFMAAALTLLWLGPSDRGRKFAALAGSSFLTMLFYLPWRYFCLTHQMIVGADHVGGFSPAQFWHAIIYLLQALFWPPYFGLFWPVVILAGVRWSREALYSPGLFLVLVTLGNLAAIVLAYAMVPASVAEFPLYMRATVDRLLLHGVPVSGLLLAAPLAAWNVSLHNTFNYYRGCFPRQILKG
ncbi:MAG: hypothetical protein BZ151_09165 [Desulfobacca sp. 4484_104]|nr:MAG: hypothetical protein BZ151_09165 [Desulfobacca sp. 4484_104]RLA89900.1 MAG: hypothetical protein DRG58_03710 [Deltaproteobacteria bacterium]